MGSEDGCGGGIEVGDVGIYEPGAAVEEFDFLEMAGEKGIQTGS